MSQPQWRRPVRWLLPAIVAVYVVVAALFAVYTPAWQAPDEPAHYNYIRYLAEQHSFPILKPGDYPASYLDEIKAAHFPADMSIAPIRYEFHQPPLYYLLAVPLYWLFGGALLPLRLLSVAIGAGILVLVYAIASELTPALGDGGDEPIPWLALAAAAFVAFLPMHVAVMAAVTNDPLAELLLAAILLLTIHYLRLPAGSPGQAQAVATMGIATGLAMMTKAGIYIAVPIVLAAIAARHALLSARPSARAFLTSGGLYSLVAVGLALPWWLRNMALYGWGDLLGLGRHELVVAGQLRAADYLAAHGAAQWLREFAAVTFHSFWGQFGWMGVPLDARLYQVLLIASALALAGLLGLVGRRLWRAKARRARTTSPICVTPPLERWQVLSLGLVALTGLLVVASYLWYNTQFVQFQGRYLFPAAAAIGLAAAAGWREVLRRDRAVAVAALLFIAAATLALAGLLRHDLPGWALLALVAAGAAFAVRSRLPRGWEAVIQAVPYLALVGLDLACLFLFIVPALA